MATKLSVLIVTADSAWCDGPGLAGRGFAVRVVGNADVALRSAAAVPTDVILVDFTTPGVDGQTLAWSLREQPRGGRAPLLIMAVRSFGTEATARAPATPGADLSLWRDTPGIAGVIVGVLNRFADFFRALHATESAATTARGPTAYRPRQQVRHLHR